MSRASRGSFTTRPRYGPSHATAPKDDRVTDGRGQKHWNVDGGMSETSRLNPNVCEGTRGSSMTGGVDAAGPQFDVAAVTTGQPERAASVCIPCHDGFSARPG